MVNNAGISGPRRRFLDDELADFEAQMRVNVFGVMVGCQRAGRHMAEQGGGSIINTTSIGGINAGGGLITYRATKAAVIHMTRCIAIDLAQHGVRVNCVAPAHIPTNINASLDQAAIVRRMQPLQRVGSPQDVANAMVYLASDRSAQVTGIVLPVDGGTTAGPPMADIKEFLRTDANPKLGADGPGDRHLLLRRPPRSLRRAARRLGVAAAERRRPGAARTSRRATGHRCGCARTA